MANEPTPPRPRAATGAAVPGGRFATFSFEWNPVTDLISRSPESAAILGIGPTAERTTGREFLARIHCEDRPGFERLLRGLHPDHLTYRTSYRYLAPNDREIVLEEHGRAMFDARGRQISRLGITADVTARQRADEALRESDRRKDELLATLSHELRSPLTPIRNAVGLMRLIDPGDPKLREALRIIDRQSAHMVRLLDDLLDASRIAQGTLEMRRETVALSDVLRQAMETSRPRIEDRNQRLEATLPAATVRVSCDPARLAQVFANLLDNATKYTNEGGEIHLEGRVENGQTVVSVSDTGRGIDPEELPHLFDSFARGRRGESRPPPGLGLGLSIVRRLVRMHGGSVTAESAGVGRGSRFTVRLPLDRDTTCRPRDEVPPAGHRRSLRVLVVDDDPDIAASTGMLLEALGHEVDLAADGDEAIRQARARHHRLILLDIGLRDSSGLQVARRLRRLPQGAGMHIAAITGYDDGSLRARVAAAGIDRHLLKPLSLDELRDLIGSVPL